MQRKSIGKTADITDVREQMNAGVKKEVEKEARCVEQKHFVKPFHECNWVSEVWIVERQIL